MNTIAKVLAGSGILIGIYLLVTNPNGASADVNSISGAFNSGAKTLQGR